MTKVLKAALVLAATAVVAAAIVAAGTAASQAKTVTIGWAYDGTGNMAAYDGPALATAKERIAQINKNKASTTKFKLLTCNTQGNKAPIAKACAAKLVGQGAQILMTTCDVDYAAPVVQYAIDRGKLTVAACIGTDQMGPKRFGAKGRLAFSFGNVAQDEGSAMAEYAWKRGWKSASLATDTVIVYFRNVVQAFKARYTQLGGKVMTMSDSDGFIHDPDGIDAEKLAWIQALKNVRRGRIEEQGSVEQVMGSPQTPTPAQHAALEKASELQEMTPARELTIGSDGRVTEVFDLPRKSVSFVKVTW